MITYSALTANLTLGPSTPILYVMLNVHSTLSSYKMEIANHVYHIKQLMQHNIHASLSVMHQTRFIHLMDYFVLIAHHLPKHSTKTSYVMLSVLLTPLYYLMEIVNHVGSTNYQIFNREIVLYKKQSVQDYQDQSLHLTDYFAYHAHHILEQWREINSVESTVNPTNSSFMMDHVDTVTHTTPSHQIDMNVFSHSVMLDQSLKLEECVENA